MTTEGSVLRAQRPEPAYRGLRRFNLIMGFLHLVQGLLMIVFAVVGLTVAIRVFRKELR